jgi:gliding motility-associated-like protein
MVVVLPYPTAIITGNSIICAGQTDTLSGSGGISFQWSTGETSSSIIIHPASASTYTLIVTDAAGCVDTASYSITVNPLPTILITGNLSICAGQGTVLNASGATSYNWSPASGLSCTNCSNPIADPIFTTTYTITASSGTCSDTQIVTVSVDEITDTLSITTKFCNGDPAATLHAPIEAPGPYQWLFDGLPVSGANTDTLVIDPNLVNHYSLQWADNGCIKRTTEILISNLVFDPIPGEATNVFSPNNDGVNDVYFPYADSPISIYQRNRYVKEFNMQVFNRWGQLIFKTDEYLSGWNGKNANGSIVSEDVYYWIISYNSRCSESNDPIIMKGFVQVLR